MEVMVPRSPQKDFHFNNPPASLNMSAPSSPRPFGDPSDYFYHHASAPTSPTRAAAIYAHFNNVADWEEEEEGKHGDDSNAFDFDFDFNGGPPQSLAAADELFESGRIRPMNPSLQDGRRRGSSPRSPKSSRPLGLWSPRHRGVDSGGGGREGDKKESIERGRERAPSIPSSGSRRGSRSLSPLRGGEIEKTPNSSSSQGQAAPISISSAITSYIKGSGSKRWRLRDLLLFRSASEGRATGRGSKDPLRKYTILSPRSATGDSKNGSFRSTGSNAAASAHEMHYTANRAAAEEMKKKTPLPYQRHGLFGYLRFNPAIHSITRGINSSVFSRGRS